ncbi:MAG: hypothetical protein NTX50_13655, partial [Candidatus Sumerlaeota bacterium]|nr:hypothetical protein [Candidatus Sumerlaeota bacterium]
MTLRPLHFVSLFIAWLFLLDLCQAQESRAVGAAATSETADIYYFELEDDHSGGWSSQYGLQEGLISSVSAGGAEALAVGYDAQKGRAELRLPAKFPAPATVIRRVRQDRPLWGRGAMFRAEIFLPPEAGAYASVQMVAYHRVWGWFGAEPTRSLKPGVWTSVVWDLDAPSDEWRSMGGTIAWNDTIRNNLSFAGLRFFSPARTAATIRIANMAITGLSAPQQDLQATDVLMPPGPVKRGQCYEVTFDLTRAYPNPFDPDCIAVDVDF